MRILVLVLLVSFCSLSSFAQRQELKGFVYKKELSFGIRVPTQGWAIFADIGRFLTVDESRIIQIELGELKNPKEYKEIGQVATSGGPTPKPFYFGKQNNLYALRFAYGKRKVVAEGAEKSPIKLSLTYLAGFSLGILKPYYLYVIKEVSAGHELVLESYSEETHEDFIDASNIYGAGGFSKGLDELNVVPGIYGKLGLNFDWSRYDDAIKSIEVGITMDAFANKVPIMIDIDNKQFFPLIYFSLQFGRKW